MRPSAGNDIVALDHVDRERSREPRFYTKIISENEWMLFAPEDRAGERDGIDPEVLVWVAWSVKESAFKFLKRVQPALGFSPRKFVIEAIMPPSADEEIYSGRVACGKDVLLFRTVVCAEYVSTVVSERADGEPMRWVAERIVGSGYADQTAAVRELALSRLETLYPGGGWQIVKDAGGCPVAIDRTGRQIPVSLSHHGHYVACAIGADHLSNADHLISEGRSVIS